MVTLPPAVVPNVPAVAATPPFGASFARIEPVSVTNGVDGELVAPPVTTASVLFTRFEYESGPAAGLIAIVNDCEPVQAVLVSVAVTVNVNVPVADGVPLSVPFAARLIPGGGVPPL